MLKLNYTLKELDSVAKKIIKNATSKVILFDAEMGMGKTTLIKAIVKALGSDDAVSSPTFSIVNEYRIKEQSIFHFDLYRVETEEELYDFGIEEYLNSDSWVLIEWPEIITPLLSGKYHTLSINSDLIKYRNLNMSL